MKTQVLKSGRRVQFLRNDRCVRLGFHPPEIDDLIQTIEAAHEQGVFCCDWLLPDLRELQNHFLVEEGEVLLSEDLFDREEGT